MSYTPGPWEFDSGETPFYRDIEGHSCGGDDDFTRLVYAEEGNHLVCVLYPSHDTDTGSEGIPQTANARLIAAAPELAEALKELCQMDWRAEDNPDTWAKARAALEKAGLEL